MKNPVIDPQKQKPFPKRGQGKNGAKLKKVGVFNEFCPLFMLSGNQKVEPVEFLFQVDFPFFPF